MAITSKFYDGPVTETDWARNRMGGAVYGVNTADSWKVTATTGDRTVSIAAGSGFGRGVADESDANVTIQLDPISSGSRWDLIAMRRDWQPAAGGPSEFVKVTGASTKALPSLRKQNPGVQDDQPLALVQVTAGQTQPSAVVDLRCWSANGGIVAVDDLARTYLDQPGTVVTIADRIWQYSPADNGLFAWKVTSSLTAAHSPLTPSTLYRNDGVIITQGGRRDVAISINRIAAGLTIGTSFVSVGTVIPPAARTSSDRVFYIPAWLYGSSGANFPCNAFVNMRTGQVSVRVQSGSVTYPSNVSFDINLTVIE